jgi:N-acyl-D-aspartate/D-glutamate deacylase
MMSEADVATGLRAKFVTIGTDSSALRSEGVLAQGSPHPRSYGTFRACSASMLREDKVLSLPDAIHRMTGLAASQIGVRDRGLIRDRHIADLVVLTPRPSKIRRPTSARISIRPASSTSSSTA